MGNAENVLVEALQARVRALGEDTGSRPELEQIAERVQREAARADAQQVAAEAELERLYAARDSSIADLAAALARARDELSRRETLLALATTLQSRLDDGRRAVGAAGGTRPGRDDAT